MKIQFLTALALIALLVIRCSTPVSGTGSEVEARCAVKGSVVYENGKPVPGAIVRIRSWQYLALDSNSNSFIYDTITNEKGYFCFNSVGIDSYRIEVNKNGKYGKLLPLTVSEDDTFPIVLPTATLIRTGAIQGRINLPITDDTARPLIAIYGVEYMEKSLVTQDFSFTGIPAGIYNLRLIPCKGSNLILELHNIKVTSDSATDVGTLNFIMMQFFNGCNSFECDSLAVRTILDQNGLENLSVKSVITLDPQTSRINRLHLQGKKLKKLTKDIGSLSALKHLDISNNDIMMIPNEIGYLNSLLEMYADSNDLVTLPYEIGYCDSLQVLSLENNRICEVNRELTRLPLVTLNLQNNILQKIPTVINSMIRLQNLYLDNNDLNSLPQSITTMKLKEFSIQNNRLCSVSEDVKSWLTQYDSNWALYQKCE